MSKKKREWKLFIYDMAECIDKIIEYTNNLSFEDFSKDQKTIDAVIRNLEVIGEVVKNIPKDKREFYSHINWKNMSGMRDVLIHDYFGVNLKIVWKVVTLEIPKLKNDIQIIIKNIKDSNE